MYVLITLAFFAMCVGLVRACDALLGPDDEDLIDIDAVNADESSAPVAVDVVR